jgi:acyl-CoA synthetase (AMP-forming)/AMP-acid ligase II
VGIEVLLDIAADAAGERVALGSRADGITFQRWRELAQGGAGVLHASGARHVAFVGVNGLAFNVAVFAAGLAGLAITPLNYRLADDQLASLIAELDEPVLLVDPEFLGRVQGERVISTPDFLEQAAKGDPVDPGHLDDEVPAVVLFTSGTTSKPKGVVLRHGHLTAYVLQTVEMLAAEEDDCALVAVPPYHVAGVATVLSNAYAGRRVVHAPSFTPATW